MDGARIFHAAAALGNVPVRELCGGADSVSVCLSKGLGAPVGSVLVGDAVFVRKARRARKRLGGGMRQAGVIAAMGMHALLYNVDRLGEDHDRATRLAGELTANGFRIPRNGRVDTNIVYFGLPDDSAVGMEEFVKRLSDEYGVRLGGGYTRPGYRGELVRVVTHLDISDEGIDRSIEGIVRICAGR